MTAPVWLDALGHDLRYGARQLRSSPGFTLVAVLSLALGIGANTAIFQLVDAVRLRTLPVRAPQELVSIDFPKEAMRDGWQIGRGARLTYPLFDEIRKRQRAFAGVFAWAPTHFNLASGGEPRLAEGMFVSGSFFETLGVSPVVGRTITPADDQPVCASPGAVISYSFWQREFGGNRAVIGRNVAIEDRPFPVIGVTPASFFGVEVGHRYEAALPLCADTLLNPPERQKFANRTFWWLSIMGRLKPGWTVKRAAAHIAALSPAVMQATLPPGYRPDAAKQYLQNRLMVSASGTGISELRQPYETPLWLLLATTGLVLLIACANLANLLLARASVREREIAVRQALGAPRRRLIGQLLSESMLLAIAGSLLGAAVAQVVSRSLVAFLATPNDPLFLGLGLDYRVLAFTAALGVGTCLLFGLLPAFRATRVAPAVAMRSGGRGSSAGPERFSLRRALVATQVALSLVLLVGALLFVGSLQKLLAIDPGFRPQGVMAVELDFHRMHYSKPQSLAAIRDLLERVRAVPGVTSAAESIVWPISGSSWNGWVHTASGIRQQANASEAGPRFFQTIGTPLMAGRDFDERDTPNSPKVAIVNEAFARIFFGGANPVGRTFFNEGDAGQPDTAYQVIGLARNSKYQDIREDFRPIFYMPMSQDDRSNFGWDFASFLVHANLSQEKAPLQGVRSAVKRAIAGVSPGIGIEFSVLSDNIKESLLRDRLMATLSGAFGLLAGLLATLGLYGVIAYMVARRQNEIGVRMALGADRGRVIRLVLREASFLLAAGLLIGTALALWAGQAASALLYGLKPYDPATLASALVLLAAVGLAASYLPARRAARMDPMDALREE